MIYLTNKLSSKQSTFYNKPFSEIGCIGALRENLCLLRMYSITLLLIFLGQLAMVGIGYYFSGKVRIFLEEDIGPKIISNYRENDDFGNIIDITQEYFQCCGISNEGYK